MSFMNKMKGFILGAEEDEDFGDVQEEHYDNGDTMSFDPITSYGDYNSAQNSSFTPEREKIVDLRSNSSPRPHVVVAKLEKFEDVGEVAKNINDKRMVIMNLESADNSTTQRIIDFIYGVTIANKSELKRVAFRTYIIKPYGYDFTGNLSEDFDGGNMDGIVFGSK